MAERITTQDIADALGLSRNTVSKALNNTGVLAESTRDKIIKKAIEMGYKQYSYMNMEDFSNSQTKDNGTTKKEVAILTTFFLGSSHFSSTMLDKFQREMGLLGFSISLHVIQPHELHNLKLPLSLDLNRYAALMCFELFDKNYSDMVCSLDVPVLFVDSPILTDMDNLKADYLYMENQLNISALIREMKKRGKTRIGFVGEHRHCQSFYERYMAFRNAMYHYDLPINEDFCIVENMPGIENPSSWDYKEYIKGSLTRLESLPDLFICANDFVAIDLLQVLKELEIEVPRDIYLCGFDDSPESKVISPPLTTIHIHSQIMGYSAVALLISRINEPSISYRITHTETSIVYRESTND